MIGISLVNRIFLEICVHSMLVYCQQVSKWDAWKKLSRETQTCQIFVIMRAGKETDKVAIYKLLQQITFYLNVFIVKKGLLF